MKARWIVAATLVAAVAAGAVATRVRAEGPTARVAPATLTARIIARAEVVSVDGVAEVRARTDGRVLRVLVREGDRVTAGQPLAEIESDTLRTEVSRREAEQRVLAASASALAQAAPREERAGAEAELAAARRELELAQDRARRVERLFREGSAAEQEATLARGTAEVAAERVRMAEARAQVFGGARREDVQAAPSAARAAGVAVDQARHEVARTRLVAPVAGVLLARRRIDPGDTVAPGPGVAEVLFEIADPTRTELRAEVEEMDAPLVRPGLRASPVAPSSGAPPPGRAWCRASRRGSSADASAPRTYACGPKGSCGPRGSPRPAAHRCPRHSPRRPPPPLPPQAAATTVPRAAVEARRAGPRAYAHAAGPVERGAYRPPRRRGRGAGGGAGAAGGYGGRPRPSGDAVARRGGDQGGLSARPTTVTSAAAPTTAPTVARVMLRTRRPRARAGSGNTGPKSGLNPSENTADTCGRCRVLPSSCGYAALSRCTHSAVLAQALARAEVALHADVPHEAGHACAVRGEGHRAVVGGLPGDRVARAAVQRVVHLAREQPHRHAPLGDDVER